MQHHLYINFGFKEGVSIWIDALVHLFNLEKHIELVAWLIQDDHLLPTRRTLSLAEATRPSLI